ncbi:hypothetical protein MM326_02865 [Alkalihalobacillus sp. LMS6]|uniref:hypothetical protein n=1 Tax=Alkalihalobacillus sp. LMS6 TaxID=2924034 RepID=UPI0020D12AF3|nr:hypothetical protein [Alkalihalobacillus sp. LMS6]UTR06991.1 hypothetical protein MM326_02865 [Alkalihalobacillus sp. LMS6]
MESSHNSNKSEYSWLKKWAKMTGDRARIDAKVNNTYIIYEKDGQLVKEFPDGKIENLR